MELTIFNYMLAMVLAVADVDGSVDGPEAELSDKELMGLAGMHYYSKLSSRNARDMDDHHHHKKHLSYKHCCGGAENRNHTGKKETWKIVKKCIEQEKEKFNDTEQFVNPITNEFSCERLKRDKNRHYCVADCVMKEVGALQGDDAVNKDIAKEFLTKGISAEWLKEIAEKGVERCAEQKDVTIFNGEQLECNPWAGYIRHCMWKEVILHCPEEHFNNTTSITGKFYARHQQFDESLVDYEYAKLLKRVRSQIPKDRSPYPETENQRYGWYCEPLIDNANDFRLNFRTEMSPDIKLAIEMQQMIKQMR